MNKREEVFNTDLSKLEEDSRELKLKIELLVKEKNQLLEKVQKAETNLIQNRHRNSSTETLRTEVLINKNSQLLEKLNKVEYDLVENRRWNSSPEALNWLNTHHSKNKRGLGFVNRPVTRPVNKKYVGLQENVICFHYGKTGHYRHTCLLKKRAMERNSLYVK